MERYAPTAKDLASRDVSRSMTMEIREVRGVGQNEESHLPSPECPTTRGSQGETSCLASVHGANRLDLGANSLLDIGVFGRACANRAAEIHKPGKKQKTLEKDAGEKTIAWLDKIRNTNGSLHSRIRLNMLNRSCKIMLLSFTHVHETLEEGCDLMYKAWESYHDVNLKDRSLIWN
ncbi:unnamed protein product [Lactuca virosa]|uniref:Uncharacterized protein n=1 Tax=Lactuca virosa TaxID=75947 RepID=A0AAU9MHQ3_9ASTR|nr:unnamed protein product [Lactuca virosa]